MSKEAEEIYRRAMARNEAKKGKIVGSGAQGAEGADDKTRRLLAKSARKWDRYLAVITKSTSALVVASFAGAALLFGAGALDSRYVTTELVRLTNALTPEAKALIVFTMFSIVKNRDFNFVHSIGLTITHHTLKRFPSPQRLGPDLYSYLYVNMTGVLQYLYRVIVHATHTWTNYSPMMHMFRGEGLNATSAGISGANLTHAAVSMSDAVMEFEQAESPLGFLRQCLDNNDNVEAFNQIYFGGNGTDIKSYFTPGNATSYSDFLNGTRTVSMVSSYLTNGSLLLAATALGFFLYNVATVRITDEGAAGAGADAGADAGAGAGAGGTGAQKRTSKFGKKKSKRTKASFGKRRKGSFGKRRKNVKRQL
jgi:hypothetical protein